ncbi:hypothetical protein BGZ65_005516 [Modicella reniformis]|uniref:Uncharacterized protein n=1 Tax=Modicella reniformis TaxID=1440133 RepID=A0A9P6SSX6_9FUNG|nr:hypothetical protein BGZ65_005516 [Modicella reniformis]
MASLASTTTSHFNTSSKHPAYHPLQPHQPLQPNMSKQQALIQAYGAGEAKITFYDNGQDPTDSEPISTAVNGPYTFSVGIFRNPVKKYGFSLENKSFLSLTVQYAGQTYDVTKGSNTIAFDFWNTTTFVPKRTDASYTQSVGGVVLISQP